MDTEKINLEMMERNQRLLEAIVHADWEVYQDLCDPSLTCFEPESLGALVDGLAFHEFYFRPDCARGQTNVTMASPHVRIMGDVAIVAYVRINQRIGPDGVPASDAFAETRVWQQKDGRWRHVHFHRSRLGR